MQNKEVLGFCGLIYFAISLRWFFVILKYHADVLSIDSSYQYADHWLFKTILFCRAVVLAAIAPVIALVYPKVLDQFINGCEVQGISVDDEDKISSFQEIDE